MAGSSQERMLIAAHVQILPFNIHVLVCRSLDAKATLARVRNRIRSLPSKDVSIDEAGPSPVEAFNLESCHATFFFRSPPRTCVWHRKMSGATGCNVQD